MARLCQSMGELCPNLKQCIMGKAGDHVTRETLRVGKKLGKGSSKAPEVNPAQARWQEVREELLKHSMEAYRIWSITVSKALVHRFSLTLHSDTAGSILATATNWEELEIQEETETGNSVTSKIRLPVQPSWYVQSLLFHLCQEVNRVGGHALPKGTLQELLKGFLDELIPAHNELTSNKHNKQDSAFPMTQNRSLQLVFDLRYLTMVLSARQEEGKTLRTQQDPRIQQAIDALESHIDPFDLDVFTPPLNRNLNRLSQRTSVLLGLLTGTEKMFTSRSTNVNSHEPYNILPLSSSQIRFGLLPLSMSSSQRAKSASRGSEVKKSQRAPVSAPRVEETFRPGNLFRQLASQEEEPAAPSLFKMGWLSSMTK